MSWMDSWSRPSKSSSTPPPLYLTQGSSVRYCQSCGRVMSARKSQKSETQTPAKYCSSRCRSQKPGDLDRRIEDAFVALLSGMVEFEGDRISYEILQKRGSKKKKGDERIVVPCLDVETVVFGSRLDPNKTHGRKKNKAPRAIGGEGEGEWKSVDMESGSEEETANKKSGLEEFSTTGFAGRIRPPQDQTDINGSIGGEKGWAERSGETEEAAKKRMEGQKVAEEKEMVKRAARRGCIFGFKVNDEVCRKREKANSGGDGDENRRKCEAIMNAAVVEPSFAKGDWGIRWREE